MCSKLWGCRITGLPSLDSTSCPFLSNLYPSGFIISLLFFHLCFLPLPLFSLVFLSFLALGESLIMQKTSQSPKLCAGAEQLHLLAQMKHWDSRCSSLLKLLVFGSAGAPQQKEHCHIKHVVDYPIQPRTSLICI